MNTTRLTLLAAVTLLPATGGCSVQASDQESLAKTSLALGENGAVYNGAGGCLDVQGGSAANGALAQMVTCNGGPTQQWRLTDQNELRNRALGDKCLTAGPAAGNWAFIYDCAGANSQKWILLQDWSIRSGYNGSLCATANAGYVQFQTCQSGSRPQVWNFGSWKDRLARGETLQPYQEIRSRNGRYWLVMQGDCNLVVYDYTMPIWSSNTTRWGTGCFAAMQFDGNFVIYDQYGRSLWATGTEVSGRAKNVDAYVAMQDDNNLVLYKTEMNECPSGLSWSPNLLSGAAWASRDGQLPFYPGGNGDPGGKSQWSNSCGSSGSSCSGTFRCVPNGTGFSCGYC